MNELARSVQWTWAASVLVQVIVCAELFLLGHFRKLRWFTAFISANVCQAVFLYLLYRRVVPSSKAGIELAWASQGLTVILRTMAALEILRMVLQIYRGIWGLGWRLLVLGFGGVLAYTAIDAGKNIRWVILAADRGLHLATATALVACVLLIRYYEVPIRGAYRILFGGFCLYSCVTVVADGILYEWYRRSPAHYQQIWQAATVLTFLLVQIIWAVALRNPLLEEEGRAKLFGDSVYQEISPEINRRLGEVNERLIHFWEPEATHN